MRGLRGVLVVVLLLAGLPAGAAVDRGSRGGALSSALPTSGPDGGIAVVRGPDGVDVRLGLDRGLDLLRDPAIIGDPVALQLAIARGADADASAPPVGPLSAAAPLQAFRAAAGPATAGPAPATTSEDGADHGADHGGDTGSVSARFVYGIGDVDGDGLDDVADATVTFPADPDLPSTLRTVVRRGVDGVELWATADDGVVAPAGDLDGDGLDDVVVSTLTVLDEESVSSCDDDGCEDRFRAEFEQVQQARSGLAGDIWWERRHDGMIDARFAQDHGLLGSGGYSFEVDYDFVAAMPGGDGARGVDRVLLERFVGSARQSSTSEDPTGTGLSLLRTERFVQMVDGRTSVQVVEGPSGEVVAELAEDGLALLLPTGPVQGVDAQPLRWEIATVGDVEERCASVLVVGLGCERSAEPSTSTVAVLDGGLQEVWRTAVDGAVLILATAVADLDGDGHAEIMTFDVRDDGLGTALLDGRTGTTRWTLVEEDWRFPLSVGDLDGIGGLDLVTVAVEFGADDLALLLQRRDGTTGAVVLATRREAPAVDGRCAFQLLYAFDAELDRDGDGVTDIGGGGISIDLGPDCEGPEVTTSDIWLESAASDTALDEDGADGILLRFPAGDLDGDDEGELLRERPGDDGSAAVVRAEGGATGAALWEVALSEGSYLVPLGVDVEGDGGVDVVRHAPAPGGGWTEIVEVLRGADATTVWFD
jgi:hypothetical protein